jgi:hypothetical protein
VAVGDVTSLLAVLNGDWRDVNIHIVDVMWFVYTETYYVIVLLKEKVLLKYFPLPQWHSALLWMCQLMNTLHNDLLRPMLQPHHLLDPGVFNLNVF